MKNKKLTVFYLVIANTLIYAFTSYNTNFLQVYVSRHYSEEMVGIFMSIGPFVAAFSSILWGIFADKAKYKNTILLITALASGIAFYALKMSFAFWYLFALIVIFNFFLSPCAGLIDTITLEYTTESKIKYGPIRMMGTISFGLLPLILTRFTEANINIIFYTYLVLAIICSVAIVLMPKVKGYAEAKKKLSIAPLFKDKKLMLLMGIFLLAQMSWAYYSNFYHLYLTQTLNYPEKTWGIIIFVTILTEIILFLFFDALFEKCGIKYMLLAAIVIFIVRWLALGLLTNIYVITVLAFLTGLSPTIATYCVTYYINRNVKPGLKASGMTLMYSLVGVPKALAGIVGGFITVKFGFDKVILATAVIWALILIFYITKIIPDKSPEFSPQRALSE